MKIYLVTVSAGLDDSHVEQPRLIRAKTKAGAIAFAAARHIDARVPTQDELLAARDDGASIEDATAAKP
jgi:hypothetical protein